MGDIGLLGTKAKVAGESVDGYHVFVGGGFGANQAVGRQVFTGIAFDELKPLSKKCSRAICGIAREGEKLPGLHRAARSQHAPGHLSATKNDAIADAPELDDPKPRTLIDELLDEQQRLTAVERFARQHERDALPAQARYYRDLIPLTKPQPGEQYAFAVDLDPARAARLA